MIYFIITWCLLTIICLVPGIYLLNLLKAHCFDRMGDRLILATWSGVIVISILLLAISFFFPLSLLTGGVVAAACLFFPLLSFQTRTELIRLKSAFPADWRIAFLCLSLLVATLINRPMEWPDTGFYHVGAVKWLAEAGIVPGIALVNYAFGFTSSWFAFTAPLVPGFLGHHIGSVANGFVFLLAAFHVVIALTHIKQGYARLSDWFAIAIFLSTGTLLASSPILISLSPDVPVILVTGVIAWAILVIKEREQDEAPLSPSVSPTVDVKTLLLILGVGALSLKLSALPVLTIIMLFYCLETRFALKRLLVGATLVILLTLPMIGYGFMTSGCPIFPSTTACIDFPWRFPQERAAKQLEYTRVLGPGEAKTPETVAKPTTDNLSSFFEKRFAWLKSQRRMQLMFLFYVISIVLSAQQLLFSRNNRFRVGFLWMTGLGIGGMTFIIFYAPILRFGLIYFILIPGLFVAQLMSDQYNKLTNYPIVQRLFSHSLNNSSVRAFAFGLTCCLLILLAEDQRHLFSLLPPQLPRPALVEAQLNDVQYTYPSGGHHRCWAASLPCSRSTLDNIRLRRPDQGLRAGFVRSF